MKIFSQKEFAEGSWAGALRTKLRRPSIAPNPIIADWEAKTRIWRGTGQRWIQFEPRTNIGPFFWSGKPAVLSSPTALYAGYYVERGYRSDRPKETEASQVMDERWHWHGFYRALSEEPLRSNLGWTLASLPETRRCVWVSQPPNNKDQKEFDAQATLAEVKAYVDSDSIRQDEWVDVIVGARYLKDECLSLQDQIVTEVINALKKGAELYELVLALPPLSTRI